MISKCERCGNEEEGDAVFYCRDCETHFCDACIGDEVGELLRAASMLVYHNFCPECSDGGYIGNIGKIEKPEDDSEEGDDD